jgi:hypothetical protein
MGPNEQGIGMGFANRPRYGWHPVWAQGLVRRGQITAQFVDSAKSAADIDYNLNSEPWPILRL